MTQHSADDNKIVTLTTDLSQIFKALISLEAIQDERSYSTLDLMEAIDLTRAVIKERIEDGFNDWKDDEKHHYRAFFDSVQHQLRLTLIGHFTIEGHKTPRFVDVYNTLILERLFMVLKELGPQATLDIIDPLLAMFEQILHTEEDQPVDPLTIQQAGQVLAGFRKQSTKRILTRAQRIDLIRTFCEKTKEVTAEVVEIVQEVEEIPVD